MYITLNKVELNQNNYYYEKANVNMRTWSIWTYIC